MKKIKCNNCGKEESPDNIIWIKEAGKKAINLCDKCYENKQEALICKK